MFSWLRHLFHTSESTTEASSNTGPLDYDVAVRDCGTHGIELVVTLVNTGEDTLHFWGASVQVHYDRRDGGRHPLHFAEIDKRGHIALEPSGMLQGHCHLEPAKSFRRLHSDVDVDFVYQSQTSHHHLNQQVPSERFRR